MTIVPPTGGVPTPPEELTMTALCPRCGTPIPVGVSMDDRGQILDEDRDFIDLYAHAWTHEVRA